MCVHNCEYLFCYYLVFKKTLFTFSMLYESVYLCESVFCYCCFYCTEKYIHLFLHYVINFSVCKNTRCKRKTSSTTYKSSTMTDKLKSCLNNHRKLCKFIVIHVCNYKYLPIQIYSSFF